MSNQNQNNNQQGGGKKKSPKVAELEGRISELKRAQPYLNNLSFYNTRMEILEGELAAETRKPLKAYNPIIGGEGSIEQVLVIESY